MELRSLLLLAVLLVVSVILVACEGSSRDQAAAEPASQAEAAATQVGEAEDPEPRAEGGESGSDDPDRSDPTPESADSPGRPASNDRDVIGPEEIAADDQASHTSKPEPRAESANEEEHRRNRTRLHRRSCVERLAAAVVGTIDACDASICAIWRRSWRWEHVADGSPQPSVFPFLGAMAAGTAVGADCPVRGPAPADGRVARRGPA